MTLSQALFCIRCIDNNVYMKYSEPENAELITVRLPQSKANKKAKIA